MPVRYTLVAPSGNIEVQRLATDTNAILSRIAARENSIDARVEALEGAGAPVTLGSYFGGARSDVYATPFPGATTTGAVTADRLYIAHLPIRETATWTRIGFNVTTLSAGNARLGIYTDSNGQAADLVLDAGTVSTGTTGQKEITISQELEPGLYWLALVCSATPTITLYGAGSAGAGLGRTSALDQIHRVYRAFTYAALPSDESAETYTREAATAPIIWLRAA